MHVGGFGKNSLGPYGMGDMKINPYTLSFDKSFEKEFLQKYFSDSVWQFRSALVLVSVMYGVFGLLDNLIVPDYRQAFLVIRFGIVIPVLLIVFVLSFFDFFRNVWQTLLGVAFVIAGMGITAMLVIAPENYVYYGGMMLVFFAGYFFIKLRFFYATIAGWTTLVFYNLGAMFFSDAYPDLIINNNFFYLSANIIGMIAAYNIEYYTRRDFFQKKQLDVSKAEIKETNINLEKKVEERTEQLKDAKERAEQSDKLKSAFLANMSHEIRTPMNGILGFAQLLRQTDDQEEQLEFLNIIDENGQHLLSLINDIIDLSRIETGMLRVNKNEFSLNNLMEEVAEMFGKDEKVKEGRVELVLRTELKGLQSVIVADRTRVKQILINLAGNAIKFTRQGLVEMGYVVFDDDLLFFVQDTGVGIEEEKQYVIFDRFMQSTINHQPIHRGSGLGLFVSRTYVQLMGGKIWVDSVMGEGSAFYFTIPFKKGEQSDYKPNNTRDIAMHYNWKDKVILVAEDVTTNFLLIKTALRKTGITLIWVKNGQEAVDVCLERNDIDLILMDVRMPVKDGYEATREIKASYPDIPVIAQTSYSLEEDRLASMDAGCADYIAKPFKLEDFLRKINSYI